MPSESVAGFLDQAKASRVLFPEQVEQLIRQPDIPQRDLRALCEYLLARGVLTRFQADAIREARGQELSFAGYPVIDEIGPCPGGHEYRALHPSLRTPLVLRRVYPDWFAPADNAANYVTRARSTGTIAHPNLVHLLDVGVVHDEVYAVMERPTDGADLEAMTKEIGGAMPGFLAAEYGRAVAAALRLAHERGGTHGDVRPCHMIVAPLSVKTSADGQVRRRPAPDAVVRLAELGLIPLRGPASGDAASVTPYLPPERLDSGMCDPRCDIYGLGATLYFLLTGRPAFTALDPLELEQKIRHAVPYSLRALRPDLPEELAVLVERMLDKQPTRRPLTAFDTEAALAKFCRPGTVPAPLSAVPLASPASSVVTDPVPEAAEVPEVAAEPGEAWGVGSVDFAHAHAEADAAPRKREMTASDKGRTRMLLILGGLLHLTAITLLVLWLTGTFDPSPTPDPPTDPKAGDKKDTPPKKNPGKKTKNPPA